ncbi:hypothetical protein LOZ36_004544 [Ophidiomyces ophidiicola]|nr:hypothetical protein LOZ36_004544 [Ophidiomyces ophidiicola]
MATMIAGLCRLLKGRIFLPADPKTSLENKTVLITGGNTVLGLEAAVKYVNLGAATVIIGCRDIDRGIQAKSTIEAHTHRLAVVQVWPLDLNRYESVVAFSDRINREFSRLDVVLLNAGALHRQYNLSPEGWENTIQTNTLSTVLLALLLLPKLRQSHSDSGPAHLTFTSSSTHKFVQEGQLVGSECEKILEHINQESTFAGRRQYNVSKILLEFAVKSIAQTTRRENGTLDVIVNSASPGFCSTSLNREYDSFIERFFNRIFYTIFGRSAEQGSRTLVSATLLGEESHGRCWMHDTYPDMSQYLVSTVQGKELQRKAWKEIINELMHQLPSRETMICIKEPR